MGTFSSRIEKIEYENFKESEPTMNDSAGTSTTGKLIAAAIRDGDEAAFAAAVNQHRRRLHVHCYQMLGSMQDAEDLVQETFLKAWSKRETFEGRSTLRGWLYRIATNACLDVIDREGRRVKSAESEAPKVLAAEVPWIQPYPDALHEGIVSEDPGPEESTIAHETIALAYVTAIQHLSPQARTVLILRDVLGWPAKDCAELLEVSLATANSALQRARATMQELLPTDGAEWPADANPDRAERELIDRFIAATQDGDAEAFVEMMTEDATFSMPPEPFSVVGNRACVDAWVEGGFGGEDWGETTAIPTRANGQLALLNYIKRPGADSFVPMAIDVLRLREGKVAEIVTFPAEMFPLFDAPASL